MNPISRKESLVCSEIAKRLFKLLRIQNVPIGIYKGAQILDVLMDLENVNDVCRLDFDKLLAFGDIDFLHDMGGIWDHFNRVTKQLENGFDPRCSKPEPKVVVQAESIDATVMDAITNKATRQAEMIAQPVGPTSGEAFDKSRATNLYLMAVRELGIGGFRLIDLLMTRTDWQYAKCRKLSEYVLNDASIKRLLLDEDIPKDIRPESKPEPCDPCDFVGDGCRNTVSTRHSCPYDVEVNRIYADACDCCEICEEKCRRNI